MTLRRVSPGFDSQKIVGSFPGQGGFIGQQQCLTLFHFPRFFLFACAVKAAVTDIKNGTRRCRSCQLAV
ncbi:hypothetical protein CSQ94_07300 [Janthinobacterium sp. BJB312]|nr:hypothetical protein CSQ94_07300 [Janthinobacterium sp. BJB312]